MVEVNVPKEASEFCVELPEIGTKPVFRAPIGGGQIEPPVDTTKGIPNSCSLTLNLMGDLQSALAAIQPVLIILDAIATLAQCLMLVGEVFSDPLKIKKLLACIPALASKIARILTLIPPFPTGFAAIITSVTDVLEFARLLLDCLVQQLEAVQGALEQVARDIEGLSALPEGPQRNRMQELVTCGMDTANQTVSVAAASLGPIARVLCLIRTILTLGGPPGKELAKLLGFPDLSNPANLDFAIDSLTVVRDVLTIGLDVVRAVGEPIGAPAPQPELVFSCPLDEAGSAAAESLSTEPVPPLVEPVIIDIVDAITGATLGSPPSFPQNGPDLAVVIIGEGFINTDQSIPHWGTSPLLSSIVESGTQIAVTVPATLVLNALTTFVSVVNQPPGGVVSPFSGLTDPSSGESTEDEIVVSDSFEVTVA